MVADRAKLCIKGYWDVVGGLLIGTNPYPLILPLSHKIGDLKTPSSNFGQTLADVATLWIDRHCEVITVACAPKYSVDSHYVCLLKNLSCTWAAVVQQFVGFSCFVIFRDMLMLYWLIHFQQFGRHGRYIWWVVFLWWASLQHCAWQCNVVLQFANQQRVAVVKTAADESDEKHWRMPLNSRKNFDSVTQTSQVNWYIGQLLWIAHVHLQVLFLVFFCGVLILFLLLFLQPRFFIPLWTSTYTRRLCPSHVLEAKGWILGAGACRLERCTKVGDFFVAYVLFTTW